MNVEGPSGDQTNPAGEVVVLATAGSVEEAVTISRAVVEAGLAACANIVGGVTSIFRWEGRLNEEAEVLIMFKTRAALFDPLAARIKKLHSYTVPEIIALPILRGSESYLQWVREMTAGQGH